MLDEPEIIKIAIKAGLKIREVSILQFRRIRLFTIIMNYSTSEEDSHKIKIKD